MTDPSRYPRPRHASTRRPAEPGGPAPLAADAIAPLDLARLAVEAAEDKKAADIVLLDVTALTTFADYFVICSGGSERQLAAIAEVDRGCRARGGCVRPYAREGTAPSHWLLVDFGSVVVHVFAPPERDFYQLERLWAEAKTVVRVQ